MRRAFAALAVLVGTGAAPAAAQTRLPWPAAAVNLAHYGTVEACLAITSRLTDSVEASQQLARLQQPLATVVARPLPPVVVDVARRCSAQWTGTTAPLADFAPLITLYLRANRDDDVARLVDRRLAAIPAESIDARARVLDSVTLLYTYARAPRVAAASALLDRSAALPSNTERRFRWLGRAFDLQRYADQSGDSATARRLAIRFVEAVAALPSADRQTAEWIAYGRGAAYEMYDYLSRAAQLDSLRRSTAAYATLVRANWAKAIEQPVARFPVGERAPRVAGDYWFSATDSAPIAASARPAPGALSLVVALGDCYSQLAICWEMYAVLARLHARHPDLQITAMTSTRGYFRDQPPPSPALEAELYRQWWLTFHRLPITLAISETPFERLPDPDRRRVNRVTPNDTSFTFGHSWHVGLATSFLVDRDGRVVLAATVDRAHESWIETLIGALQQRGDRPT